MQDTLLLMFHTAVKMKVFYVCMQVSYVVSAMLVLVTVYFIAPLFESLPLCVLASIIVVACIPLFVHYVAWRRYWRTDRYDFAIWVVSFCGTIIAGVDYGMVVGLAFSVFVVHFRMQVYDIKLLAIASFGSISHMKFVYWFLIVIQYPVSLKTTLPVHRSD